MYIKTAQITKYFKVNFLNKLKEVMKLSKKLNPLTPSEGCFFKNSDILIKTISVILISI